MLFLGREQKGSIKSTTHAQGILQGLDWNEMLPEPSGLKLACLEYWQLQKHNVAIASLSQYGLEEPTW